MSARQTHAPNAINHLYPLHNANYNVTALVTAHTGPADTNDDGYADFGDYNAITSHFGHATGGGDAVGDLNHDGVVDELDVDIWLSHNGNSYGATPTWQVTERLAYNPYGAFTVSVQDDTGTWRSDLAEYLGWNITFQGGRWDSLTRMVSFAGSKFGRSENVDTGRWVSQDIGYLDSSNLYLFCAANPINRMDPDGESVITSPLITTIIAQIPNVIRHFDAADSNIDKGKSDFDVTWTFSLTHPVDYPVVLFQKVHGQVSATQESTPWSSEGYFEDYTEVLGVIWPNELVPRTSGGQMRKLAAQASGQSGLISTSSLNKNLLDFNDSVPAIVEG